MKKRTVLFVSNSSGFYGAEKVLYNCIRYLQSHFTIHVVVPGTGILAKKLAEIPGIKIHYITLLRFTKKPLDMISNAVNFWSFCNNLRKTLKVVKPDVIYCNSIRNVITAILARLFKYPVILHIHECNIKGFMGKLFALLVGFFPQKIIFVSEFVRKTFAKDYPAVTDKSLIVWNGIEEVDANNISYEAEAISKYKLIFPVLATVAQLEPHKRINDLIPAMELLKSDYPSAMLLIIGDGPLKETLNKQITDRKLQNNVSMLDYITDVISLLSVVDIFLCPFEDEGLPLVVIEAMTMKKPVVAAASGGLLEIVEDGKTGFFYPVGDIQALVEKIKALIASDTLRVELGLNGYMRVKKHFSIEKQMDLVKSVIDGVIADG